MRLSGVNYRRIETARPFGVGFSAVAGKAQFHFISRGPVLLRMASGEQFTLESGDALFIPNGDGHALLSDPQATVVNVAQLPSETVCSTVSCINAGDQPDCPERAVIFSGCMDFELGGMQPLVKAMPEVMRVSSLLNTGRRSSRCWRRWSGNPSPARQAMPGSSPGWRTWWPR